MGVINLGILLKKLQTKLINSGFVKDTDYATAEKGGTIKVGAGLKIENGVLSVADASENQEG